MLKFWIRWRTTLVVAAAAAAGLLCQSVFRETSNTLWFWASVIAALAGAGAVPFFKKLDERREKSALFRYQEQLGDGLEPLLQQMAKLSEANSVALHRSHLSGLVRHAMEASRHVVGQGRVRASYYRVQGRGKTARLMPEGHTGRGTMPQTEFRMGTPEGNYVFKEFDGDRSIVVLDTASCSLPGWDRERARDYRAFISVPVRTSRKVYGMITVDAPEVGDLEEYDEMFIRCVALLLASGIAMVLNNTPQDGRRRGTK